MFRLSHLERQLFTSRVHLQRVALLDVPSQELLGQRILQVFLHSATSPVDVEDVAGQGLEPWVSV